MVRNHIYARAWYFAGNVWGGLVRLFYLSKQELPNWLTCTDLSIGLMDGHPVVTYHATIHDIRGLLQIRHRGPV